MRGSYCRFVLLRSGPPLRSLDLRRQTEEGERLKRLKRLAGPGRWRRRSRAREEEEEEEEARGEGEGRAAGCRRTTPVQGVSSIIEVVHGFRLKQAYSWRFWRIYIVQGAVACRIYPSNDTGSLDHDYALFLVA